MMAEATHLPKAKGGTLVQTGQSQLATAGMPRELKFRQNQNLVMFLDGEVEAASAESQERVAGGNANVFDILHRQELKQQQRPYGALDGASWSPTRPYAAPPRTPTGRT